MTTETFVPSRAWFQAVAPDGIPLQASTIISGPGGSGKPLIGFAVVESWLEAGGSVAFLLTNSDDQFVYETMDLLYDVDRETIDEGVVFVDFDPSLAPSMDSLERGEQITGNLLVPEVWDAAIEEALSRTSEGGPGTLLFGTALNLFMFSPTYRESILETFVEAAERTDITSLFTVSTSAFEDEIAEVEAAADTVLMTEMADGTLRLRGERSDSVELTEEVVDVPFTEEQLQHVKSVAEESRDTLIPTIKSV